VSSKLVSLDSIAEKRLRGGGGSRGERIERDNESGQGELR
jgi:hypothetical protein